MQTELVLTAGPWWRGRETRLAEIGFLMVVIVWGGSFVLTKEALRFTGPFAYNALRMSLGTVVIALLAGRQWRLVRWHYIAPVLLTGVVLFSGYALQSYGQQFTTASKAGFLTGTNVVYVPLFSALLLRRRPARYQLLGVFLAFVGMLVIAVDGDFSRLQLARGDIWVALSGLSWALYAILLSYYAQRVAVLPFAALHVATAALCSGLFWLYFELAPVWSAPGLWIGVLTTGFLILGVGTSIHSQLLRRVAPTRAALIAAMEPLFAAVAGWLIGESITAAIVLGGLFIIFGIVLSEVGDVWVAQRRRQA